MLNKVILSGNVGRAPKVCLTQEGKEIVTFYLATSQYWKDETGEWQSVTDWHHIAVFRESTIRWLKDVLKRGDPVYVEGKLTYHSWTDKYGQKRSSPHVVITNREGRVEYLRPSSFHDATSQPLNLTSNLKVQDLNVQNKLQPISLETEGGSERKDDSGGTFLEIPQEETQALSH